MASVIPKFVTLKLSNVAPKSSDKTVTVQSVSVRPQYDKGTHKPIPDSIDGYNLTFYALRSGSQTVKLPKDVEPQIKKIKEALDHDAFVSVSFGTPSTFRARFYAMESGGRVIQGITANAEKLEIVSIEQPDLDDLDDPERKNHDQFYQKTPAAFCKIGKRTWQHILCMLRRTQAQP